MSKRERMAELFAEMSARKKELENYDPRIYYTDGEPDLEKLAKAGKLNLVQSFTADGTGKVVEVGLLNDRVGHVYILGSGAGLFKIGRARDTKRRLRQVQHHSPVPVSLYYSRHVRNSLELEGLLHKGFSHLREHGEWFRLEPSDLERAKSMIDEYE